jgi:type IV pilus assembly protein PilO
MPILPQQPREQKLFMMALVAVAGLVVYQQMYWSPAKVELDKRAVHADSLDSLNATAKRQIRQGTSAKARAAAADYTRQLTTLRTLVPTQNEVPALLQSVTEAARRVNLDVSSVKPSGVVQGDEFDTYKYTLGVTGPYHKIAEFLTNVGSLPRIVEPINLNLRVSSRAGERKPGPEEQFLDATFDIETYVAHAGAASDTAARTKR